MQSNMGLMADVISRTMALACQRTLLRHNLVLVQVGAQN